MTSVMTKPVKGILKSTQQVSPPSSATRRAAVQHAQILENRKEAEAQILDNIIQLIDFPLDPPLAPSLDTTADTTTPFIAAAHPSKSDSQSFRSLIRIFQPTDYDDLITERNLSSNCGYTLCPLPRQKFPKAGNFKLINVGRKDFDIVETKELEKWCSPACARRALYIKVQLHETAAWERWGMDEIQIDLLDEGVGQEGDDTVDNSERSIKVEKAERAAILATERGDDPEKQRAAGRKPRMVELTVREKQIAEEVRPPVRANTDEEGEIEGYRPNLNGKASKDECKS